MMPHARHMTGYLHSPTTLLAHLKSAAALMRLE